MCGKHFQSIALKTFFCNAWFNLQNIQECQNESINSCKKNGSYLRITLVGV